MSALYATTASIDAGCGGTIPCTTDSPATSGMPIFTSESPERRAIVNTNGITQSQGHDDQCDERVQLEARDEDDQRHHRKECEEQQRGVWTHAAWFTRSPTIVSGVSRISHTHVRSSGAGSSRIASWLSSSEGGMKCPRRLIMRSASSAGLPARYTNRTSVSPSDRSRSR